MNTITYDSKRNYWPLKYLGEVPMINKYQKNKLISLIYSNIDDENERELRLSELQDLTGKDADYALYQFSTGKWS